MKTRLIIIAAGIAALLFSTTFEAAAAVHHRPAKTSGHLVPNNDGKLSWVSDANGSPAASLRRRSHASQVRLASLASADAPLPVPAPARVAPMGEKTETAVGNGTIVSAKTGATAHVSAKLHAIFQSYVNRIEANGGEVLFMNGIDHRGACAPPRHKHGCGWALDVCQLARGIVDARCHLPSPQRLAEIARSAGLFEGGQWCDSDYGHAEWGRGVKNCSSRHYATGRQRFADRRHYHHHRPHRHRLAHRARAA